MSGRQAVHSLILFLTKDLSVEPCWLLFGFRNIRFAGFVALKCSDLVDVRVDDDFRLVFAVKSWGGSA